MVAEVLDSDLAVKVISKGITGSLPYPPTQSFTFVDLFCGAGGFTEGFLLAGTSQHGFQLVGASDISAMTQLTYEGRFKTQLGLPFEFLRKDMRDPSFADELVSIIKKQTGFTTVDVVCGGPPCQGYSVFGARNEYDARNDLFRHYLQVIEILQPRYFVLENVPGLVKMYGGRTVDQVLHEVSIMAPIKYNISGPHILNAADFGVPQLRERVLFIGCRDDMPTIESVTGFIEPSDYVTVGEAIGDLGFLKPWESSRNYLEEISSMYQSQSRRGRLFEKFGIEKDNVLHNHEAAKHGPDVLARFSLIEKGKGLESIPREIWDKYLHTKKRWCVRLDDNKPSYTIVTLPDDFVHPYQHRVLTVRENARLQSFDDTFVFYGPRATGGGGAGNKKRLTEVPQYSQVGNAVPPLLAKGIAEVFLQALLDTKKACYTETRRTSKKRSKQME